MRVFRKSASPDKTEPAAVLEVCSMEGVGFTGPAKSIRAFVNRHRILLPPLLFVGFGAIILFSAREAVMGQLQPKQEAVASYERFPVPGEKAAYETFEVMWPLREKRTAIEVAAGENSIIEVGFVRIRETPSLYNGFSGKIRFSASRGDWLREEVLAETTGEFPVGRRVSLAIDGAKLGGERRRQKILLKIEKADEHEEQGYEPYRDFALLAPNVCEKRRAGEMNVIIVSFDTLRPDHLGCYGYGRDTSPNIDGFAQQGVLFTQVVSPAPWTTPAHYSLFTGLNPSAHQNRARVEDSGIFYSRETLASVLKQNGFYTTAITDGGLMSSVYGFGKGFNTYREYLSVTKRPEAGTQWAYESHIEQIFDEASRWLEAHKNAKFFMFLHTYECHMPYEGTHFVSKQPPKSLIDRRKALYDGDIKHADSYFGTFVEKLQSLNLMADTLVVFLSDHGDDFYDHYRETDIIPPFTEKLTPEISAIDHDHSLYEELVRVPLIFHIPGLKAPKRVLENQVRLIDVMPTILDPLGIDYAAPIQGTSLMSLMRTGEREEDPPALSEFTGTGPERKAIRKDGYKYIWIEKPDEFHRVTYRNLNRFELFNLTEDPHEKHNIYAENRQLADRYHALLSEQLATSLRLHSALEKEYQPSGKKERVVDEDLKRNLKALGYVD